jgi:pyruvate/2-oxoglutarate dehydrogenase complex dihydrolipoamide dehydrogenase (E3) component
MSNYHTIIIGSGSGGITVAVGLAGLGKKVAIVEAAHVGGDCTNVGCVPSKTLIHAVDHMNLAGEAVLEHVRAKRNHLRDEETEYVRDLANVTLIEGRARLTSASRVHVDLNAGGDTTLQADNIVLATGAKPFVIPVEGLPESRVLTNETMFEQETVPKHLVIVGGGVISLEMAFAFRKLGSQVSVVERGARIASRMELAVSEVLTERLEALDAKVYGSANIQRYDDASETLMLEQHGNTITLEGVDKVLLAIGRAPAVNNLGLAEVGVTHDKRGIPTDAYGGTNIKNVYAIGDVNTASAFTHSANAQGRRLVQRLAFPWLPRFGSEPIYPSATFSEPEVAMVGGTLTDLHKRFPAELIKTVRFDLTKTDKGYTESLEHGFVIIHALRLTGRVVGATIVAPKASEMISLMTAAIYNNISLYKLSQLVFPYPTLSEGIKKAADAFVFETLPKLPQELLTYLRYRWQRPKTESAKAPAQKVANA